MDDVQIISKMSNSPLRCVQSTAETPNHSEKAERIFMRFPNDRCDELDKRMQKTVAPVEPVTKHRSNQLASDTPVSYHWCIWSALKGAK